ncbi:MAG: DUF1345 domain-containing protein [Massilia sp.]
MNKNLLHRFIRNRPHLSMAILLGIVVAAMLPDSLFLMTRALISWNAAVWAYLGAMMWVMARADHRKVRAIAGKQDESAGLVLATLSLAALVSLYAIVSELSEVARLPADERTAHYLLTALTIVGSWFLVGVLFCFHYAHLYYRGSAALLPLKFPDETVEPDYWDFLYFAFTIAVAVQTSDVMVMTRAMRKLVLGHAILSFFFNLVILGLSINIAAGVIKP